MEELVKSEPIISEDMKVGDVVVKMYKTANLASGSNTDTSFAVFYPSTGKNLPVVLYQSGMGGSSSGHKYQASIIAADGYVVVLPDRDGDQRGGYLNTFMFLMLASPIASVSADGSHLMLALEYVKLATEKGSGSPISGMADPSTIIAAGFSMGGNEAIHFAAKSPDVVKAAILISPSVMWFGTISFRISHKAMTEAARDLSIPTLWITSEKDMTAVATYKMANEIVKKPTLVTFKSSVLDLDTPTTKATTHYGPFLGVGRYIGMADHFSLGNEKNDVSTLAILPFMKNVLSTGEAGDLGLPDDLIASSHSVHPVLGAIFS